MSNMNRQHRENIRVVTIALILVFTLFILLGLYVTRISNIYEDKVTFTFAEPTTEYAIAEYEGIVGIDVGKIQSTIMFVGIVGGKGWQAAEFEELGNSAWSRFRLNEESLLIRIANAARYNIDATEERIGLRALVNQ